MKTPDFDLACDSDLARLVWKEARRAASEEGDEDRLAELVPYFLRLAERKADILGVYLEEVFR